MSTTETPELKRKRSTSPNTHQQHKPINLNNELSTLGLNRPTGRYIPRPVLKAMLEQQSLDSSSADTQRLKWDQLRKSINGLINKVNTGNIKLISPQLFQENLIRGRGLFARSVIRAQSSSLPFTPIFAALVAIINSKLPQLGELLVQRLINQFRKSYRRNDKLTCNATVIFIAHLVNQSVISDVFALELALFLLSKGGDDGVEIAVQYIREVGAALQEREPAMNNLIYEELRNLLHDANISKRVQYMIEVLFQIRKDKFKDNVIIPQDLDLVEEDEQIVHDIDFNAPINTQDGLNIFKFDPNYEENEEKYASIRHQILGSSDEEEEEEEEEEDEEENDAVQPPNQDGIVDHTGTNLVNLRRTIYLTIMNSLVFDEAVHKLMRIQIPPGDEIELCNMIVECCSQERTYNKFYGLIGERFSKINRMWQECFQKSFTGFYDTIHRYETNRLRNIARFFGHLFASDGVNWGCMNVIKITQQDTTSSSRIFVKILFNEIVEMMGLSDARKRFADPAFRQDFSGLFPTDHPANTRFAINYFTAIGLGAITEEMREYLKHAPKNIPPPQTHDDGSGSDSDSSSVLSSRDTLGPSRPPRLGGDTAVGAPVARLHRVDATITAMNRCLLHLHREDVHMRAEVVTNCRGHLREEDTTILQQAGGMTLHHVEDMILHHVEDMIRLHVEDMTHLHADGEGIQPTGIPHLGNYLGALKNWKKLQDSEARDTRLIYSIVGYHAITLPQQPAILRQERREMMAALLAIGLDPHRSIIFHQDQVAQHTELAWILNSFTPVNKLQRMTTWKSKIATLKNSNDVSEIDDSTLNLGLLSYPVLQAADIMLYKATHVPVGEDQQQHLELTRDLAEHFNRIFKCRKFFPLPTHLITPASRILNLRDPLSKMSKSHPLPTSRIMITDSDREIASKIKSAVTDSDSGINFDALNRPGVSNLLTILADCEESTPEKVSIGLENSSQLKEAVAEALVQSLSPIRGAFHRLSNEHHYLDELAKKGQTQAAYIASDTMNHVKKHVGLD
ncbi:hypothetical protein E3P91_00381 [Wallemia ichthyophaga]|nr:hypothetical protein E3P91_00381 [Wallemia ichthyophaga]